MKDRAQDGSIEKFAIAADDALTYDGRLCVPKDQALRKQILTEAHNAPYSAHPGGTKMYHDLKKFFWWIGMKRDIGVFVERCMICQQVKAEHQRPGGLLQPLEIPEWKWEHITMDFVVGLPRTMRKNDAIWVIVDRLTKSSHFLPVRMTYGMEQYARIYIREIMRLHGVPVSIVSDRDPRFTSKFWKSLQSALGTKLNFSTAYHPQTDGQSERTIKTLEDLLRACVLDTGENWKNILPLVEFAYNNSYQATIQMALYEALYGRKCRSPLYWSEVGEGKILGPELIGQTVEKIAEIRSRIKTAQDRQKSYADKRRKDIKFEIREKVFLKVAPMKGVIRFGKKGKLQPRFIGPFEILDRVGDLAYRLALPPELSAVHNVFHVSILRRYVHDPEHVCNYEELQVAGNLTYEEVPIAILERKIHKLRNKDVSLIKVQWSRHSVNEATWEREEEIRSKYPTFMFQEKIISRTYGLRIVESSISSYQSSSSAFIQVLKRSMIMATRGRGRGRPANRGADNLGDQNANLGAGGGDHGGQNNHNNNMLAPTQAQVVQQFRRFTPPPFNGREGPAFVDVWFMSLERTFELIGCTDAQRIICGQYQMVEVLEYNITRSGRLL
ncbi:hypothetical protein OROMI_012824 [Orobanche minor]